LPPLARWHLLLLILLEQRLLPRLSIGKIMQNLLLFAGKGIVGEYM
jgi:hypothetical protein